MLKDQFEKFKDRFVKIRGNPRDIALGFSLGIFVGLTPTMGFQMIIAIFFASLLRWNKFSAAAAVWFTNPLTAIPIYGLNYWVGTKIFFWMEFKGFPRDLFSGGIEAFFELLGNSPSILLVTTLGGFIVSIPACIFSYFFAYRAIINYRDKKEKVKGKLKDIKEKRRKN
ncbi:MAG: DUF2062 domain-containing protein [Desulfobacterales bacterium]|nr:DUF2062 domain-containing protein [Desulfobacterales bacterium]MCP4158715.1 DUF2062 domain-containing protein [Deltaproteobacteria bacterium]